MTTITLDKRQLEEAQILIKSVVDHPDVPGALQKILDYAYCVLIDAELERETEAKPVAIDTAGRKPLGQQTARLTDKADEAEASIRELLATLNMADLGEVDSATARDAVRGYARLARDAHERAREAARMAEELHESQRGAA